MPLPGFLDVPLRLLLLGGGLLLPGSMILRALRLPWSLAAAFATSTATLYLVLVIFGWTGAAVSLGTLAAALGLVALLARLVPARAPVTQINSSFACFRQMGGWLPLYLLFWAVVAYRLGFQPLSGPDTTFRWSWLAEQMLRFGSLDFYPPHSGEDFVRYFWAESIPPEVAGVHAWAYACGGSLNPLWTSPAVALQVLAIHELVWRLGSRWGGAMVARRAVLFAAACPLLTWSVLLGQETGLIALAVVGLVWALSHATDPDGNRWVVLAALFSVVATGAREYGPVYPAAVVASLLVLRAPPRQVWLFAGIALPFASLWPLRVWQATGNPLYSLNLAGIFPTNAIFTAWNDTLRAPAGQALDNVSGWLALARYGLLWAAPAVVGFIALLAMFVQRLREARLAGVFIVVAIILWFSSVGYTAGGLFYSLRVLSPALALLCVTASYGLAFVLQRSLAIKIGAACVGALLLESLPKTLVLPENPYRAAPRDWLSAAQQVPLLANTWDQDLLAVMKPLAHRRRIVSDYVGAPKLLAKIDTEVVPLWSPDVAWLFDEKLSAADAAKRWRESGLHYLVLLKVGPTANYVQDHARWRAPYFTLRPVAELNTMVVLEVTAPAEVK